MLLTLKRRQNIVHDVTNEIRRAIYKERLDIQLARYRFSLRQFLTKKNNNTLANCPIRDPNICQKTYSIYRLICLKFHDFYIKSTIRRLHIRIKEHLNTRVSSFHKHLFKCKNNDNNFSIKIKGIVSNVGNLRIKEALLIARQHSQINTKLELDNEYIIS